MGTATAAATLASYKNLVREAATVDKHRKEVVPRFDKLKARLKEAAAAGDGTMIQLYRSALTAEINHITKALYDVNGAQVLLNEVRDDEDFVAARLEAVAKVAKVVADAEKALTRCFKDAKALENDSEKAADAAYEAPEAAFRELAWLDRNVEETKKAVAEIGLRVGALRIRADGAVDAADAKLLAQVQAALEALSVANLHIVNDTFVEFATHFIDKVGQEKYENGVKAELIDGARDLLKEAKGTAARVDDVKQVAREIEALTVDTLDVRKALKVLGLEARHLGRLGKALALPRAELERGLDATIRELKLADASGKQWLAELRKAGVLPR